MFMKFKALEGPVYWTFTDPDSGYIYRANSKPDLVKFIVSYRAQNQLPEIEYLGETIDNYLCHHPSNKGRCEPMPSLKRGLMKTIRGGIALLETWLYDKTVTQEKADERAAVCVECPHNVFPRIGAIDKWSDAVAFACLGDDRKSKYNDKLGHCEVCSCVLKSKVFFGGEIELTKHELVQMPDFCWQKKEVEARG